MPVLTARVRPERIPLSFAQRRLWFLGQLDGGNATYNSPLVSRSTGRLDRQALAAALRDVVIRHESLRTVFPTVDGEPYQHILDPAAAELGTGMHRVAAADLADAVERESGTPSTWRRAPIRAWLFMSTRHRMPSAPSSPASAYSC